MTTAPEARLELNPFWGRPLPSVDAAESPLEFHRSLPEYRPTPLIDCPRLAARLGLGAVMVKDESCRFGLNSFKALGPSYALPRLVTGSSEGRLTVAAASEGNHGRALAWAARRAGYRAVIYMGHLVPEWRRQAIRDLGATVRIVQGRYDDAVDRASIDCLKHDWVLVSDTAVGDDPQAAEQIVRGYTTLFEETREQLLAAKGVDPHIVMLQAGVGGLAAAAVQVFAGPGPAPLLVTVEPLAADCLLTSIRTSQGEVAREVETGSTAMECLNCARPSEVAWPWIRSGINAFMAVDDAWAFQAVDLLKASGVESLPSGAAGLAGLVALLDHPQMAETRQLLQLNGETRGLVINTEGSKVASSPHAEVEAHEVV